MIIQICELAVMFSIGILVGREIEPVKQEFAEARKRRGR